MIVELPNRPGHRCDSCHQVPPTWFTASCPSSCGFVLMACGRCASRAAVEDGLAAHAMTCPGFGAIEDFRKVAQNLSGAVQGAVSRQMPQAGESMTRQGARLGARMGSRRGQRGEQVGAVAGAALGALGEHVLGKPEMQPAVKLARGLYGVVQAVGDVLQKK
jgi:hypothetical protein